MSELQISKKKKNQSSSKVDKTHMAEHKYIVDLWDSFFTWLRSVKFSRPKDVDDLLPQYYASQVIKNIRLAAIFSIDVVKVKEL